MIMRKNSPEFWGTLLIVILTSTRYIDALHLLLLCMSKHDKDWKWRDVVSYEGLYVVSEHGIVLSLSHPINKTKSPDDDERWLSVGENYFVSSCGRVGVKLNPSALEYGHLRVVLNKRVDGEKTQRRPLVHRLVLEAFVGPGDGMVCSHLDGNTSNNKLNNLKWCTQTENCQHRRITGNFPEGENSPSSKYCKEQIIAVRILAKEKMKYEDIAKAIGMTNEGFKDETVNQRASSCRAQQAC